MIYHSVQPRDRIFVNGYAFLPFAKITGKDINKDTSKNLSSKNSKSLDHA